MPGEKKWNGKGALIEHMRTNPEEYAVFKARVMGNATATIDISIADEVDEVTGLRVGDVADE